MSLFEDASLITTPNGFKAGKLYSIKPTNGDGDLDVVRATTATRVNSDGLIEEVAINVPRLDYTNGSCPSILVEPQRTNLLLRSEEFDNAFWTKTGTTTPIITANSTSSPDGTMTADLFTGTGGLGQRLQRVNTLSLSTPYSISVFLKANTATTATINVFDGSTDRSATLTFSTGAVSISGSGITASVINFTNGWYRLVVNYQSFATTIVNTQFSISGLSSYFIWGAQLEAGSNATSYIPTVASAVTRNADVISKTGIADLINSSEGVLFVDIKFSEDGRLAISKDNNSDQVVLGNSAGGFYRIIENNVNKITKFFIINNNNYNKIALKYKSTETSIFVNGVKLDVNTTSYSLNSLSKLVLTSQSSAFYGNVNSIQLYKTALTDQECINLTTL